MSGHPDYYRAPLDGPPLLALFEVARAAGIPVLMHVSPMRLPKQMPEFEHLVSAFPTVTVIAAHYARTPPDFSETKRLLDSHPNLFMDVSMGIPPMNVRNEGAPPYSCSMKGAFCAAYGLREFQN